MIKVMFKPVASRSPITNNYFINAFYSLVIIYVRFSSCYCQKLFDNGRIYDQIDMDKLKRQKLSYVNLVDIYFIGLIYCWPLLN